MVLRKPRVQLVLDFDCINWLSQFPLKTRSSEVRKLIHTAIEKAERGGRPRKNECVVELGVLNDV